MNKKYLRYYACLLSLVCSLSVLPQALASSSKSEPPKPGSVLSQSRLNGLAEKLGNKELVIATQAKVKGILGDGPGVWAYEWRLLGEKYEAEADKQAKENKEEAHELYKKALAIYRMGYLPGNYSPAERKSYDGFRRMAAKINEYVEFPFTEFTIPFENKEIIIHLVKPEGVKKPPLVLYTGGTDGSKEENHMTTHILASKGVAVASFDLAGTGESMQWNARPDSDKLHKRILDYFEETNDYDFSRVGLIGGSFGGYYAVKMAAEDKRLKAVINHCGLIDSNFQIPIQAMPHILRTAPGTMVYSAIRRMGFDPERFAYPGKLNDKELADFDKLAKSFSLVEQGIVGSGKKTITIPLLIINGSRDPVVNANDIKLVEDASTQSDTWIMGLAGHCAPNYMSAARPDMMEWLVQKLNQEN